jgi:D-alanine-D-alanine ligase
MTMRIGFVYDARDEYLAQGYSDLEVAEFDSASTIDEVEAAMRRCGASVERIGRGRTLARRLAGGERWDLVFSIAEGLSGRAREAQVPALCEMFDQAYAFSDPLTMAATLDKAVAKRLVRDHGVPTTEALAFPLFVKPVAEGTGKGCEAASIVYDRTELENAVARLIGRFTQPAIAEPFLPGREFTVGIIGNDAQAEVIGVLEIVVRPEVEDRVYSFDNKEECESRVIYRLANDPEADLAGRLALDAYRALDCRDAARIDMRSDAVGVPQFLEVNPIAGLHPGHSDLPMLTIMSGHSYDWLIGGILDAAAVRLGLDRVTLISAAA